MSHRPIEIYIAAWKFAAVYSLSSAGTGKLSFRNDSHPPVSWQDAEMMCFELLSRSVHWIQFA